MSFSLNRTRAGSKIYIEYENYNYYTIPDYTRQEIYDLVKSTLTIKQG